MPAHRSPDGQCLILTSRDGYCTIVIFDQILPAHHIQQSSLQLESIALAHHMSTNSHPHASHHHSHSHSLSQGSLPPSAHVTPSPTPAKRSAPLPPLERPVSSGPSSAGAIASLAPPESAASSSSSGLAGPGQSEASSGVEGEVGAASAEPPKKKRRVALTRVGDVDS